jgi:diguanylate cyclase (GGDEF)-like protein
VKPVVRVKHKLFLPNLALMLVFVIVVHFIWLPKHIGAEKEIQIGKESQFVEMLATALTAGLLSNDIAQLHLTLNKLMKDRKYWHAVTLHNADNIRLFPIAALGTSVVGDLEKFVYEIEYEKRRIGSLELLVDIESLVREDVAWIQTLEKIFLGLALLVSIAATFWQNYWIQQPLRQLHELSTSISNGNYDSILSHRSSDELGTLVRSFVSMRNEIRKRESEIREANSNLSQLNQKLEQISNTDAITNIANRRHFDEALATEISRHSRQSNPLTLILCDIDYFKLYNDTHGHQQGDKCLRRVAGAISKASARGEDLVARYGGEEFAVILPNTDQQQALKIADKIRARVDDLALPHKRSAVSDHVTVSLGFASVVPDTGTTMSDLIEDADRALYRAKRDGRNRVCAA